tara:strand:+ start:4878 stop:5951 length:1074 start_codon:yes stop_codon:yes gene_type:complete
MSSTIKVNNIQNLAGDDSGIDLSTNDQIILKTANTTAITVDSSQNTTLAGDLSVGDDVALNSDSSKLTFGADSEIILEHAHNEGLKLQGSGTNTQLSLLSFHSTNGTIPDLRIGKSGSDTVGTFAETANGESIAQIRFTGVDSGGSSRSAGQITVIQDGSSTGSSVPANMRFATSGSERFRIMSDGRIGHGATANISGAHFTQTINSVNGCGFLLNSVDASGNFHAQIIFRRNGADIGSIQTNASSTLYATSSDHRLKENVEDMTGAIDRVKQLSPKRFNFIADKTNTLVDGFLAHEAQSVVAEAVTGTHNEVDDDDNPVMQGIDQSKLVPLLTGALKEAIAKIEALEAKVTALEGK